MYLTDTIRKPVTNSYMDIDGTGPNEVAKWELAYSDHTAGSCATVHSVGI
jgi:hypothetical protein